MAGWYLISLCSTLQYDCPLEMQSTLRSQCTERLERTQHLAEWCPFVLLLEGAEILWLSALKRLCLNISSEASHSPVLLLLWHVWRFLFPIAGSGPEPRPQQHIGDKYTTHFPMCFSGVEIAWTLFCQLWTQMQAFIFGLVECE